MAEKFDNNIEKLREKSRILLARVDENFKRVNIEVRKLRSQTLFLINYYNYECQGDFIGGNTGLWKLRNDSSRIRAILSPDFFSNSSKCTIMSLPNMTPAKLTLTSKKPQEQCMRIVPRKPVKDCYCYPEANKIYSGALKLYKAEMPPHRSCKSQSELKIVEEISNRKILNSSISCETFRRVREIDYTPRSQFLRNVQNKICELQNGGQRYCSRTCSRLPSYHRFKASTKVLDVNDKKATLSAECVEKQKSPIILTAPVNSIANESDNNICTCLCKRIRMSTQKQPKATLRKTISSKESMSISLTRNKQMTESPKQNCRYYCRDELKGTVKGFDKCEEKCRSPEYQDLNCLKYDDTSIFEDFVDQEVEDLRKFREQNYFETHGSSHILMSRLSGSLQQYLLNERLFPEPVGKIHRQDLVVTIPSCVTTQKKHIHYFPRHVVCQEKNICNTNYRRKRYQNCPLTGHAIDLGILKTRTPLNSLALKYQKRIP